MSKIICVLHLPLKNFYNETACILSPDQWQYDRCEIHVTVHERKEERDYLRRIDTHPESYSKNKFDEKLHGFGTLTMVYKMEQQKADNQSNL